jgi:hypothetical protein
MMYYGVAFAVAAVFSLAAMYAAVADPFKESFHNLLGSRTESITELALLVLSRVVVMTAAAVVVTLPFFLFTFALSPGWQPVLGSVIVAVLAAPALGKGAELLDRHMEIAVEEATQTQHWTLRLAQRLRPLLGGYVHACRPLALQLTSAARLVPGPPVTALGFARLWVLALVLLPTGVFMALISWMGATAPELLLLRESLPLAALVGVSTLVAIELFTMCRVRMRSRTWAALTMVWAEPALIVVLFEVDWPLTEPDLGAWTLANVVVALAVAVVLALFYDVAVTATSFLAYLTQPAGSALPLWLLGDDEWAERLAETPGVVRVTNGNGAWRRVDLPRCDRHPKLLTHALRKALTKRAVPVRSCVMVTDRRSRGTPGGAIRRWSDLGGEWRVDIEVIGDVDCAAINETVAIATDAVPRAWRSTRMYDSWLSERYRYAKHLVVPEADIDRITRLDMSDCGDQGDRSLPVAPFDAHQVFGCYVGSSGGKVTAFLTVGHGRGYFFAARAPAVGMVKGEAPSAT